MSYFVVVELDITDPEGFSAYGTAMARLLERSFARVLCASDDVTAYEGDRVPGRVVVFEWPSQEAFESFRYSPEYQAIIGLRLASAKSSVVGVSA